MVCDPWRVLGALPWNCSPCCSVICSLLSTTALTALSFTVTSAACAARAGGALLPQRGRCCDGQQGGPERAHRRLPGLGRSLRPQSSAPDRVGRKGGAQGRSCAALATPHGEARRLWRLF